MPEMTTEDQYAVAARRHFEDARYLGKRERWPNADHHFGFAAECALKTLLLLFTEASMDPKPNGKTAQKPWIRKTTGGAQEFGHLPWSPTELAVLATGPLGQHVLTVVGGLLPAFANWTEQDRYRSCDHITRDSVTALHDAAHKILALLEAALLTGKLEAPHDHR
ncbi:hypothetical protein ABZ953_32910 [Streptomyces sp. NPDC046465]|uniref:hypothetical protein n=1 Tax=Streptomyces sp. NPDC046465 TaxID=3155810 RepID=UPI0033F0BF99